MRVREVDAAWRRRKRRERAEERDRERGLRLALSSNLGGSQCRRNLDNKREVWSLVAEGKGKSGAGGPGDRLWSGSALDLVVVIGGTGNRFLTRSALTPFLARRLT